MGFALIFIGILLTVSAVRGNTATLFSLLRSDFTGQGNFVWWLAAVLIIGAIGYIPAFRTLSRAMLALVIVVLILTKGNPNLPQGGFFGQIVAELGNATSGSSSTSGTAGSTVVNATSPVSQPSQTPNLVALTPQIISI